MKNQNNNIVSPSNYYGAVGQPVKSKNNLPLVIGAIVAVIVLVGVIVGVVMLINRDNTSVSVVVERENNPVLELYKSLNKEEMTLAELQQAVEKSSTEFVITVEDGFGVVSESPDSIDALNFYINTEEEFNHVGIDVSDSGDLVEGVIADTDLDSYGSNDIVYYFRYAHKLSDDESIGISYVEEEGEYEVFDGYESYLMPTKDEAIEAYLAPVVK